MRPIRTARQLGATVRQSRLDHGWTQAQLAAQARVSRPWVSELDALGLALSAVPLPAPGPEEVDLDALV